MAGNVAKATTHDSGGEFEDIDTTPVSPKELRGWYAFGGSVYAMAFCFSFFISLIVESLAAAASFETSDHSVPCNTTVAGYSCVVPIHGAWIDPSSFYFYCLTVATFVQLVLFVGMGAVADHGNWRKKFMVGFSLVGAIPCILLSAVTNREAYMFGGALAVVGMVGLGGTYLFVHAFLPPLARNHPDYVSVRDNTAATRDELRATLDFITNKISSTAFVWMYGGAVISLFVTVVLNARLKVPDFYPDEYTFQIVITVVAIGWLIACAVVYKYLRDRPGPPLPAGENVMLFSVRRVFKSLGKARKLSNLYTFLLGWFFYSDAWGTQAAVSVLWTKTQLGFTSVELLIMAAEVQLLALIGTFAWNRLQMHTKISTKTSLLIQSSFCALIPAWGILGLFPSLSIGYKQKIEFFVAAGIHGLFTGATQSSCRSLFAQLLPAGEEAQYFSLYQIADKGSSWIGPLAVAAIYNSGASRWFVFVFSLCQFSVAAIVFSRVNLETGISQGTPVGAQEMDLPELTIVQV